MNLARHICADRCPTCKSPCEIEYVGMGEGWGGAAYGHSHQSTWGEHRWGL